MIDPTPPGLFSPRGQSSVFAEIQKPTLPKARVGFFSRLLVFFKFLFSGDDSPPESWYKVQYQDLRAIAEAAIAQRDAEVSRLEDVSRSLARRVSELEASEEVLKIQIKLSAEAINAYLARIQAEACQYNAIASQARKAGF